MIVEITEEEAGLLASLFDTLDGDGFVAHTDYYLEVRDIDVSQELWALGQVVHKLRAQP